MVEATKNCKTKSGPGPKDTGIQADPRGPGSGGVQKQSQCFKPTLRSLRSLPIDILLPQQTQYGPRDLQQLQLQLMQYDIGTQLNPLRATQLLTQGQ